MHKISLRLTHALTLFCLLFAGASPVFAREFFFGGMPQTNGLVANLHITVITNEAYVVGYDETRKDPVWVAYKLVKQKPAYKLARPNIGYPMDEKTLSKVPANAYSDSPKDSLIGNQRWDHGHMAANDAIAKVYGKDAQLVTFKMSNMCPQSHRLNGGKWKTLESMEYRYSQDSGELWTICGPIFDKHIRTLTYGIEVPSSYYKILVRVVNNKPQALAITFGYYPPVGDPLQYLKSHLTTIREIEKATGLDFFNQLPKTDQDNLEMVKAVALW